MKNIVESIYSAMREQRNHQVMESVASAEIKKATDILNKLKLTPEDLLYFTSSVGYYEEDFDEAYEDIFVDNLPDASKDDLRTIWDVCHGLRVEPRIWVINAFSIFFGKADFNDIAPSGLVKLKDYLDKGNAEDSERYLNQRDSKRVLKVYDEGFFFVGDDGEQILLGVPKQANAQVKKFVIALGDAVTR